MSRLRTLAGLVVVAVVGLLVTPTAAVAATPPLTAFITCDPATGTITTGASGRLLAAGTAPTKVTVEFQRRGGTRVTATTSASLAPMAQPFRTTATTTASGDVAATGYTGTFDPATSLFYQEKLLVTFKNAAGAVYTTREATCSHDRRTTVSLTCDPAAATVTATVTGVNGQAGTSLGAGRPTRIGYRFVQISQSVKGDPLFRSELLGPGWDIEHRLTQAADGTWTDPGFVHSPRNKNLNYYAEELTVGVFDAFGAVVGGGFTKCTLFNGPLTA